MVTPHTWYTSTHYSTGMSDSLKIPFVFLCGLRGYHEYRSVWTPTLHEVVKAKQESGNCYDRFVIACTKKLPSRLTESVVGHLPKEVSRYVHIHVLRYFTWHKTHRNGYGYSPLKVAISTGWLRNPNPSHCRNKLV